MFHSASNPPILVHVCSDHLRGRLIVLVSSYITLFLDYHNTFVSPSLAHGPFSLKYEEVCCETFSPPYSPYRPASFSPLPVIAGIVSHQF